MTVEEITDGRRDAWKEEEELDEEEEEGEEEEEEAGRVK